MATKKKHTANRKPDATDRGMRRRLGVDLRREVRTEDWTVPELRTATLTECRRRVEFWAPGFWCSRQEKHLRSSVKPDEFERHADTAKAVYQRAFQALADLADFADSMPDRRDGCMQALERIAREVARPALTNLDHFGGAGPRLYTPRGIDEDLASARRLAVVANYDRPDHWWWSGRRPTRTELAVLSILAGNLPDLKVLSVRVSSPAEVIEAEAATLDKVRRRLGLQKPSGARRRGR